MFGKFERLLPSGQKQRLRYRESCQARELNLPEAMIGTHVVQDYEKVR